MAEHLPLSNVFTPADVSALQSPSHRLVSLQAFPPSLVGRKHCKLPTLYIVSRVPPSDRQPSRSATT